MIDVLFYHHTGVESGLMNAAVCGLPPTQDSQRDSNADDPEPETPLSHPALFISA